jgi:hypothetical protein
VVRPVGISHRLDRHAGDVRAGDHVVEREQRMVEIGRFLQEDIETRAGDPPGGQRLDQSRLSWMPPRAVLMK